MMNKKAIVFKGIAQTDDEKRFYTDLFVKTEPLINEGNVVAFSGVSKGCGTTTVVFNTALFNDVGRKILIIDADRDEPSLTKLTGVDLEEVKPVAINENLDILNLYNNNYTLIHKKCIESIQNYKSKYDRIFIDLGAGYDNPSSLALLNYVDYNAIVVNLSTDKKNLITVIKTVEMFKCKFLGFIFNKI